ncbi:MAG: hypothetical protein QOK15_3757, partial [Nocardioidaceae bacterium]|nr:hypothetical protein [Nocardioidaceae bacterium]
MTVVPVDRRERLALLSARVPFRLKVALVWLLLFGLVGALFALSAYDTG